jgi:hypothetical protein
VVLPSIEHPVPGIDQPRRPIIGRPSAAYVLGARPIEVGAVPLRREVHVGQAGQ